MTLPPDLHVILRYIIFPAESVSAGHNIQSNVSLLTEKQTLFYRNLAKRFTLPTVFIRILISNKPLSSWLSCMLCGVYIYAEMKVYITKKLHYNA